MRETILHSVSPSSPAAGGSLQGAAGVPGLGSRGWVVDPLRWFVVGAPHSGPGCGGTVPTRHEPKLRGSLKPYPVPRRLRLAPHGAAWSVTPRGISTRIPALLMDQLPQRHACRSDVSQARPRPSSSWWTISAAPILLADPALLAVSESINSTRLPPFRGLRAEQLPCPSRDRSENPNMLGARTDMLCGRSIPTVA